MRDGITVQPIVPRDLPRIFELSRTIHLSQYETFIPESRRKDFQRRYSLSPTALRLFLQVYRARMRRRSFRIVGAVDRTGTILGYAMYSVYHRHVKLTSLFVATNQQGKGIGKKLLGKVFQDVDGKLIRLEVLKANRSAISLYEKVGFVKEKTLSKKYFGAALIEMQRLR